MVLFEIVDNHICSSRIGALAIPKWRFVKCQRRSNMSRRTPFRRMRPYVVPVWSLNHKRQTPSWFGARMSCQRVVALTPAGEIINFFLPSVWHFSTIGLFFYIINRKAEGNTKHHQSKAYFLVKFYPQSRKSYLKHPSLSNACSLFETD